MLLCIPVDQTDAFFKRSLLCLLRVFCECIAKIITVGVWQRLYFTAVILARL
jgi:hypothetical protein